MKKKFPFLSNVSIPQKKLKKEKITRIEKSVILLGLQFSKKKNRWVNQIFVPKRKLTGGLKKEKKLEKPKENFLIVFEKIKKAKKDVKISEIFNMKK